VTTGDNTIIYVHGLDLVAQSDGTTTDYLAYDGLGSVRQVLDDAGAPLLTQTFDPYGNLLARGGMGAPSFGFTGEQVDANGLVYLRARYYQPGMGRFLNMDPGRQEMNPYQYSHSNPTNYADPSGLMPVECMVDPQSDLCKTALYKPSIVSREQWGARDPVSEHEICYPGFGTGMIRCATIAGEGFYDPVTNIIGYACYTDLETTKSQSLAEVLFSVVIHHAGNTNDMTIQEVQNEHMDEVYKADIGYHFVIAKDGTIYEGRDIGVRGAHVEEANTGRIGVLVVGDFEPGDYIEPVPGVEVQVNNEAADTPTSAQLASLIALTRYLDVLYGLDVVEGHNDVPGNYTRCPGDNLEPVVNELDARFGGG
jgi:RHS repeat-associated protein